jgi:hypothetical protein
MVLSKTFDDDPRVIEQDIIDIKQLQDDTEGPKEYQDHKLCTN